MSKQKRYWLALHPDIKRPIGGAKQAHRLVEALNLCGRESTIIQENEEFHPGWFESIVPTISMDKFKVYNLNKSRDIIIMPETFLPAIPNYASGIPKIIFNQNSSYTFGLKEGDGFPKPKEVIKIYRHPDIIHVICISEYDKVFITSALGVGPLKVSKIINGIETNMFKPNGIKKKQIAYMPRKNKRDSGILVELIETKPWFAEENWKIIAIDKKSQAEVAKILQESMIFLAFGHPEGFGLPLAEAAACGCFIIGYSGIGGREIFKVTDSCSIGCNVEYGDLNGFIDGIENFRSKMNSNRTKLIQSLQIASNKIREIYSPMEMINSVRLSLANWEH